eukprot:gnl/TRDRNA2_/TRDRNA2_60297_c0_seq1.p2 gnl/TRDRNA2_/TRDRNA2_60297_c0~~gnl/TRDRNA2_/TRDRNA2_60297_c0_seq1.p2  ORF type:complete len:220 (+),score=65.62 gnl/TRDRNA2_/TRDRNA2_60297_c0_seq1:56-715(+)
MADAYAGTKRKGLSFKGETDKTKKKRRDHQKAKGGEVEEGGGKSSGAGGEDDGGEVPVVTGSGRIVSTNLTLHGFETQFQEELEVGDTILVHHPTSLEVEMKIVTGILSQRSATIHQEFSKDLVSTIDFHIRKDSLKLQRKAQKAIGDGEDAEAVKDAASKELEKQLEKKLKKQARTVVVREKTGMWGYKNVTRILPKATDTETMLDIRCKEGRDKYCY